MFTFAVTRAGSFARRASGARPRGRGAGLPTAACRGGDDVLLGAVRAASAPVPDAVGVCAKTHEGAVSKKVAVVGRGCRMLLRLVECL